MENKVAKFIIKYLHINTNFFTELIFSPLEDLHILKASPNTFSIIRINPTLSQNSFIKSYRTLYVWCGSLGLFYLLSELQPLVWIFFYVKRLPIVIYSLNRVRLKHVRNYISYSDAVAQIKVIWKLWSRTPSRSYLHHSSNHGSR